MSINNLYSLKNKVALVTGATGHLGKSMAEGLAMAGATVYINGRTENKVIELTENLNSKGYKAHPAIFDVTDYKKVQKFFDNFCEDSLDILLLNAYNGIGGSSKTSTPEQFRDSYEVSMIASHILLQNALFYLKEAKKINGDASVINIASMYGMVSPDISIYESELTSNPPFYGASKAALIQWTKYTACELAKYGVRVNAISPGAFPPISVKKINPNLYKKITEKSPIGRVGLPNELIGPVVFLASSSASYITGVNLPVDGGWTAW
jgi:NAD(P)-dependent dehydrogenase (short-subunit alcohol dehydrogenase family)